MRGKLIVIEGTDCSGKETQSNLLLEKLTSEGVKVFKTSFPMYDTPTGKIVGGPYLGKDYISKSWFKEGAAVVDPKVASLYYAADRKYNINIIEEYLNDGVNVILDRYVTSNMAHQGGKLHTSEERFELYNFFEKLEYDLLELPKPDLTLLLYMPYKCAEILKRARKEGLDGHEVSEVHLINAENAYLELAKMYDFKIIKCAEEENIRTIEDINEEVYSVVKESLNEHRRI